MAVCRIRASGSRVFTETHEQPSSRCGVRARGAPLHHEAIRACDARRRRRRRVGRRHDAPRDYHRHDAAVSSGGGVTGGDSCATTHRRPGMARSGPRRRRGGRRGAACDPAHYGITQRSHYGRWRPHRSTLTFLPLSPLARRASCYARCARRRVRSCAHTTRALASRCWAEFYRRAFQFIPLYPLCMRNYAHGSYVLFCAMWLVTSTSKSTSKPGSSFFSARATTRHFQHRTRETRQVADCIFSNIFLKTHFPRRSEFGISLRMLDANPPPARLGGSMRRSRAIKKKHAFLYVFSHAAKMPKSK